MTEKTEALKTTSDKIIASLGRRQRAEKRFRLYGISGILVALSFLGILLFTVAGSGLSAFFQNEILLDISFEEKIIDPKGTRDPQTIRGAGYFSLVQNSLRETFPEVKNRKDLRTLFSLVSRGASHELSKRVQKNPDLIGTREKIWLPASGDVDMFMKGKISRDVPQSERRISDKQILWIDSFVAKGALESKFNFRFFTSGDSREPEMAGIWGAIVGSALTLVVTLLLSFPIGVTAAIYLEELSQKGRWTNFVEVNINNLAAVPSIIYGLLGLAIFQNVMHLPRSAPLVGGMVLALMTLPTIIIATRAAFKAVPPSIREAARGLGASPVQVVLHHVLPLATPGIMTGTIIGMARALGESAPLLMIGMVAFIVDIPKGPLDPATALPVQIYLWADSPERAFVEKTAAATLVLLAFLILMNGLAVLLRNKFERRW